MRDYAKVAPSFWTRGSGKRLRGDVHAQLLALYLVTCPSATMAGIFYVPFVTIVHETGLTEKETRAALSRLTLVGFADYDYDAELAWVPNAASYQLGDGLDLRDKRRGGLMRELATFGQHRFVLEFFKRYSEPYLLAPFSWMGSPFLATRSPLEGAQNQEQEQEQEQEQDIGGASAEPTYDREAPPDGVSGTMRVAPVTTKRVKASRISPDWQVSPADVEKTIAKGVDPNASRDAFVDYWLAASGPSASKLDWDAAFRTWVRKSQEYNNAPAYVAPPRPLAPRRDLMAEHGVIPKTPEELANYDIDDLFANIGKSA